MNVMTDDSHYNDDSHYLAELKQQMALYESFTYLHTYLLIYLLIYLKMKKLILLRSTLTLWQCAAKVISTFLIFAVLVLRVNDCRPYTPF